MTHAFRADSLLRLPEQWEYLVLYIAAALVLDIFATGGAMAEPFGHQHGKTARDEERGQRGIFRLRRHRAMQNILRRRMRDDGERKRPVAGRAKQQRMRRGCGIGRGHQPWLAPVGCGFCPLRAKHRLRRRTVRGEHRQEGRY